MTDANALEVQRTLGRLEEKVDTLIGLYAEDHPRLVKLEVWRTRSTAWLAGSTATLTLIIGVVWQIWTR